MKKLFIGIFCIIIIVILFLFLKNTNIPQINNIDKVVDVNDKYNEYEEKIKLVDNVNSEVKYIDISVELLVNTDYVEKLFQQLLPDVDFSEGSFSCGARSDTISASYLTKDQNTWYTLKYDYIENNLVLYKESS